ncbi:hypothetical protein HG531_005671 [Fusarium graminearum]|nr:hypothetical protein HG531_005671 [Fusarium graminearum]
MKVLDKSYGTSQKANIVPGNNDRNTYQLGTIGDHHVVINCPQSGTNGQITACQIATSMKSTFPCIRFILLVGIGGGAPSTKYDIRLGDVVIGTSVSPYRKGKMLDFGKFKQTSNRETPPAELLGAITELQHQVFLGSSLETTMDDFFRQKIDLREKYPRPNEDRLLVGDYFHNDQGCVCLQQQLDDHGNLVDRKQRAPGQLLQIHTGTIGSSDEVMKSAKVRDRLADKQEIICFEMEAAAVMQTTRSISVRGISDYSDGHKNDAWHNYAALTAAVCAKELLKWLALQTVQNSTMELTSEELKRIVMGTVEEVYRKINQSQRRDGNAKTVIEEANDTLKQRIENLEQYTGQPTQGTNLKTMVLMRDLQKQIETSVHDLQTQVKEKTKCADRKSLAEWKELKQKVDNREKDVKNWGETCQKLLDAAIELSKPISDHVGGRHSKFVPKYLESVRNILGIAKSHKANGSHDSSSNSNITDIGDPGPLSTTSSTTNRSSLEPESPGSSSNDKEQHTQDPCHEQPSLVFGGHQKPISGLLAANRLPRQPGSSSSPRQNPTVPPIPKSSPPPPPTTLPPRNGPSPKRPKPDRLYVPRQ